MMAAGGVVFFSSSFVVVLKRLAFFRPDQSKKKRLWAKTFSRLIRLKSSRRRGHPMKMVSLDPVLVL
jgi:hypothetical protein